MNNKVSKSGFFRAAASALALSAAVMVADAGTRSYSDISASPRSVDAVTIQTPGQSAVSKSVIIPYSKSTTVELPVNLQDVFISNPDIVESIIHTSRRVVLIGKSTGQTNAYFYGHNGEEVLNLEIRVERDMAGLEKLIQQHAGDSNVEIQAVNNNILLTGSVANAGMSKRVEALAKMWLDESAGGGAGKIVNLMSVEGKDQVLLKVRIVEMQRSLTKQMGINLNTVAQLGDSTVSLLNNNGLQTGAGLQLDGTFNNAAGGAIRSVTGQLTALERVGLIRTLAEPTLTSISGETANFQVGGEFPLLTDVTIDDNGQPVRQFEYKNYGVSLGFTPVVLSEGRISLNISTEISEPTTEGSFETGGESSDILGLRVRRANTVVELPAGGSLVIAGLIREEARQSMDGTPGMREIPGLGALFRNRDELTTQTELVMIVTPYLVDPTHPDKLQTPLDGFVPASDMESLTLGRLNKLYGDRGRKINPEELSGPFGHSVD